VGGPTSSRGDLWRLSDGELLLGKAWEGVNYMGVALRLCPSGLYMGDVVLVLCRRVPHGEQRVLALRRG
jgi:hypothetical protein